MLPAAGKNTGSELGADSMAVTVGGVDRDGHDATNELSTLFLDAVKGVRGLGNSFSIRIHRDAPSSWLQQSAEVLHETSGPALFSDEAVVEALVRSGCSMEDARDYGVIGCVEPTPAGNTFGCTSGNDISLAGALEMTLLRGMLRIMGKRVGPDTGDPAAFRSFEQLMEAFRAQVRFMVETVAAGVNIKDAIYARHFHNPYVSMTLEGCLEHASDMTCGGARYNFSSISARGVGTAVDSLAAIRWAVFQQRRFTLADLLAALVRGYFEQGGMELSCNVVDDATLRDAQRHPERHRDLVVRVSGYAAFYCDLGPAIQEEIIARTTFEQT